MATTQPSIRLADLPPDEQRRIRAQIWSMGSKHLRRRHSEIRAVTVGTRRRDGVASPRAESVLRVYVDRKVDDPAKPIPSRVEYDCWIRTGRRKLTRQNVKRVKQVTVSVPTDVTEWTADGRVAAGAPIFAKEGPTTGCLAARVGRLGGTARRWISAAHVLTRYGVTGKYSSGATVQIRSPISDIGKTMTSTCWRKFGDVRVDVGLVNEEHVNVVSTSAIQARFADWMPLTKSLMDAGTTQAAKYRIVDQEDAVRSLTLLDILPAGIRLQIGSKVVTYPRMLHFEGKIRPGDSGTCIYKTTGEGLILAGIGVGFLDSGGVVAIPIEDAFWVLRKAVGDDLHLMPLGVREKETA